MEIATLPRIRSGGSLVRRPLDRVIRSARVPVGRADALATGEFARGLWQHRPSNRTVAFVAAGSAAAAGAIVVLQHAEWMRRPRALPEYEVWRLSKLRDDEEALALIQRELAAEWGAFAPQDLAEMRLLVERAGHLTYVIRFREEDGRLGPVAGVLQTARADIGGDPTRLLQQYGSFNAVTSGGTWEDAPSMAGDTALLLQITAFGERSRGVGTKLRDAALYSLPRGVRYALTMTPVDDDFDPECGPEDYPPAVNFHYRGGAELAGYAKGFKLPPKGSDPSSGRQHNRNVAFLRYTRLGDGSWRGVARPGHLGPPRKWGRLVLPAALHLAGRAA